MALFLIENPSSIFDRHFGQNIIPEDMLAILSGCPTITRDCRRHHIMAPATTPTRKGQESVVSTDHKQFQVTVNVQQFSPEEVSVKTVGNEIIIEGKHEEKKDQFGSISRHFVRRYTLPEGHRSEDVVSSLSRDGTLTVTAPRKEAPVPASEERVVPITFTENSHKPKEVATKEDTDNN